MKTLTRLALSATAIAVLSAVPAAAATIDEAVVPPSNSAANQYTETFPTSGGDKKTDQKPSHRSPSKVLGGHNAHKLEAQGPEGEAAAETAAATAPTTVKPVTTTTPKKSKSHSSGGKSSNAQHQDRDQKKSGGGHPNNGSGAKSANPPTELPSGSSGLGSALEQATGVSTSGQGGLLLPLVILATIIWSLAYLWRQRQQVD